MNFDTTELRCQGDCWGYLHPDGSCADCGRKHDIAYCSGIGHYAFTFDMGDDVCVRCGPEPAVPYVSPHLIGCVDMSCTGCAGDIAAAE